MPECRVIRVTNVAPTATKDQMKTLFGYIGNIDDIVMYPELETTPSVSRVCFVKYDFPEDVGVSLHLSSTVFIDRALTVTPVPDGKIPDEKTALASLLNSGPDSAEVGKAEEICRTVYVSNLTSLIMPDQLLQFFGTQAGEVKYVRMAGDEGFGAKAAFIEFTEQASVQHALTLTGQTVGGCVIRVVPANTAITKPAAPAITSKDLEQAMKKVNEAQPLISAVVDPDRKSRSRSRSRRSHSRRSRSRRHSRSRSRKRSRSRSHRSRRRSRSRSKHRSRSPRRSRQRRSRSKSRDRRRRSKSRSPKSGKSRRSRSREKTKKTDSKSRDNTPADSSKRAAKRDSDEKKTTKESEKEHRQTSRHRSRSPKTSSRRRSRSRSDSQSRVGRKGRDERRKSRERGGEKRSQAESSRDDARESDHHSRRERNGHDREIDHDSSDKSPVAKRSRDADHESDIDDSEQKLARTDDNMSEGDGNHSEDED